MSTNTTDFVTSAGNAWIICKSKSYAGRIYYFNTLTGQAVWNLSEPEMEKAKSATKILEKQPGFRTETGQFPEPSESPKDFSNTSRDTNATHLNFKLPLQSQVTNISKNNLTNLGPVYQTVPSNSVNYLLPHKSLQGWNISAKPQTSVASFNEIPPWKQQNDFISVSSTNIPLSRRFPASSQQTYSPPPIYDNKPIGFQKTFQNQKFTSMEEQIFDEQDLRLKLSARKILKQNEKQLTNFGAKRVRFQNICNGFMETNDYTDSNTSKTISLNQQKIKTTVDVNAINISVLKKLIDDSEENIKQWFVVTDSSILLHDLDFLQNLLSADEQCCLVVPKVVMDEIQAATNSDLPLQAHRAAYYILQQYELGLAIIDEIRSTPVNKYEVIKCCSRLSGEGAHVILLTNDMELLNLQDSINVPVLSVSKIQKLLCTSPIPEETNMLKSINDYKSSIKITIPNDNKLSNTQNHVLANDSKKINNTFQQNIKDAAVQAVLTLPEKTSSLTNLSPKKYQPEKEPELIRDSKSDTNTHVFTRSFSCNSTISSLTNERKQIKLNRKRTLSSTKFDQNAFNGDISSDIGNVSENSPNGPLRTRSSTNLIENMLNNNTNSDVQNTKSIQGTGLVSKNMSTNDSTSDASNSSKIYSKQPEGPSYSNGDISYDQIGSDTDLHTSTSLCTNNITQSLTSFNEDLFNDDDNSSNGYHFKRKRTKSSSNINENMPTNNSDFNHSSNTIFNNRRTKFLINRKENDSSGDKDLDMDRNSETSTHKSNRTLSLSNLNETKSLDVSNTYLCKPKAKSKSIKTACNFDKNLANNEMELKDCHGKSIPLKPQSAKNYDTNDFEENDDRNEKNVMFEVTDQVMENYLKIRCDEWVSRFTQIMEEALTQVLQQDPPFVFEAMPPPWTLYEATECVKRKFHFDCDIIDAANKLCYILLEMGGLRGKIKANISPQKYMKMYSYGVYLIDSLQGLLSNCEDLQTASESLSKLWSDIQNNPDKSNHEESFGDGLTEESNNVTQEDTGLDRADDSQFENTVATTGSTQDPVAQDDVEKSTDEASYYNLRSLKRITVRREIEPKPDFESTFFSSLKLQKNAATDDKVNCNENISNETNDHELIQSDLGKQVADECNQNDTSKANNTFKQPCTEPQIIRKFTTCLDIEQKLKNRFANFEDYYESQDEELDYEHDGDNNYDESKYYDNSEYFEENNYDGENNYDEENNFDRENCNFNSNDYVNGENLIEDRIKQKIVADSKKYFASITTVCNDYLKKLQSPNTKDLYNKLEDAEKIHSHTSRMCCLLESILKREGDDAEGPYKNYPINSENELDAYRFVVTKSLEQGRLLERTVKLIINAINLKVKS